MRLAATWDHDRRLGHPELEGLPSLEACIRATTARVRDVLPADRAAVVDGDVRLTGDELESRVRRLAAGLAARGVGRGDAICFQLPSWWETIAVFRACWTLGAVASPIHHLAAHTDVERIVEEVQPVVSIAAAGLPGAALSGVVVARGDGAPHSAGSFEALLEHGEHDGVDAEPDDLAVVLFTSGSTGGPKGVLHTHRGLVYKVRTLLAIHGLDHRDVVLMPAPMAHISGLSNAVLQPGVGGLTSVLMDRWTPERAVELVRQESVSFMMGPPTFFLTMIAAPNFSPEAVHTMRLISCGGAGVTPSFAERAGAAFGAVVKRTYGSTEAPVVSTWHAGDPPERAASSDGRAAGPIRIRIVDPDTGEDRPAGEVGEVWVQGPELFVGYADGRRNEGTITADDWFRTGDLGRLDDGWLHITGRIKDLIIRGGENISASEVEHLLEAHPAVDHAVAVGFPDDRLGERVCAFVVAPGGFDLDECRRWFESNGATKFTWPERVVVLDAFPTLAAGKADREALRRLARS